MTDKNLPMLLGALLAVAENEISIHAMTVEKLSAVLDGQILQTGGNEDPTVMMLLSAQRLQRTRLELGTLLEHSGQPDHPIISLAAEAAQLASTAVLLQICAVDPARFNWTEADFRSQVSTLHASAEAVQRRHADLAAMLPDTPPE